MREFDTFDDVLKAYKRDAKEAFENTVWYDILNQYEINAQELYSSYEPYQYQRRGSLGKNLERLESQESLGKYGGEVEYMITDDTPSNTRYGGASFPLLALIEEGHERSHYKYKYPYNRHGIGEYTKPRPILSNAVEKAVDRRKGMYALHNDIASGSF